VNLETSGVAHDHYGDHTCPDCTSWVDAEHVANYLAAGREWVYRHALELDGRKRALHAEEWREYEERFREATAAREAPTPSYREHPGN
jgi:hypothetical protein